MKKISSLLSRREALLREAHLANLAFAYVTLQDFWLRIGRAGLFGQVTLKHAAPDADRFWATLTAHEANQSVIEEHFTEEDLMALADVLSFITTNHDLDISFALEDFAELFVAPLRAELERKGIAIDQPGAPLEEPYRKN